MKEPTLLKIATECFNQPRRPSIWLADDGRYVCPESEAGAQALVRAAAHQPTSELRSAAGVIQSNFKLIFLTAVVGTFLFTALCVGIHLFTGGQPPKPMERLVDGMFDLVKIGFGALAGLLAGKVS